MKTNILILPDVFQSYKVTNENQIIHDYGKNITVYLYSS